MIFPKSFFCFVLIALLLGQLPNECVVVGQQPSTTSARMFPSDCVLLASIADASVLQKQFGTSNIGKLVQSDDIPAILNGLFSKLQLRSASFYDMFGLSFDELVAVPSGELTFAMFPEGDSLSYAVVVDAKEELPAVAILLGRIESKLSRKGWSKTIKKIGSLDVVQLRMGSAYELAYFFGTDHAVICSRTARAEEFAAKFLQNTNDTLDSSPEYRHARTSLQLRGNPSATFFFRAAPVAKQLLKFSSTFLAPEQVEKTERLVEESVDSIFGGIYFGLDGKDALVDIHVHRKGNTIKDVALQTRGPDLFIPEAWVPSNSVGYSSLALDVGQFTEKLLGTLKDIGINLGLFAMGGQVGKSVSNFFGSRYSFASLGSGESIFGIRVKDNEAFRGQVLNVIRSSLLSYDRGWKTEEQSGETISVLDKSDGTKMPRDVFSFGLRGKDFFVVKNLKDFFKSTITVDDEGIGSEIEFKLVAEQLRREATGKQQVLAQFLSVERYFENLSNAQPAPGTKSSNETANHFGFTMEDLTSLYRGIATCIGPLGALLATDEKDIRYSVFTLRRN